MLVRCANWKDCPVECEHKKPHEPMAHLEYIGGVGDALFHCDEYVHTCGLRNPWVKTKCLPVVTDAIETLEKALEERELAPA